MRPVFDPEMIKKAIATPEQIEKSKKIGAYFWHQDPSENIGIRGYEFNGVVYITAIENLSRRSR